MEKQKQNKANETSMTASAKQVAAILGVSVRQVWRLDSAGKLPKKFRIGGSCKWLRSEIESWVSAGCPDRQAWEVLQHLLEDHAEGRSQ